MTSTDFEKYQAEALVHKHVPLTALKGVVCYNDSVRTDMQAAADAVGAAVKIIAQPNWYLSMITFTEGNLLEADAEALVNTINTVGVMGKGVALMFKEAFPENFKAYETACKEKQVQLGKMFVTERVDLLGPKWIINFPTKGHWRYPSQIKWIQEGLNDLVRFDSGKKIRSIAIPPLGSGNGGLAWSEVKPLIEALGSLKDVAVIVYEPTTKYQNVAKREGVENLTAPRALIAELVRRYSILGIECTLLEVQKLGYFT